MRCFGHRYGEYLLQLLDLALIVLTGRLCVSDANRTIWSSVDVRWTIKYSYVALTKLDIHITVYLGLAKHHKDLKPIDPECLVPNL